MGIDNEAVLVYGWVFSYEEITKGVKKLLGHCDFWELDEDLNEYFKEHHPDLTFGYACPYYDGMDNAVWYITFIDSPSKEEMKRVLDIEITDKHKNLLKQLSLVDDNGEPEEIELYVLPHVS
uniref:Uncharacterized protein n=1 Tax=Pithovirus LCPAC302 TaxID=2506593 RepID=A0A481Z701_9VIRU|nr:MAG: hypothetical protein LCPAC302_02830 [Pithovirus LCPAC302]